MTQAQKAGMRALVVISLAFPVICSAFDVRTNPPKHLIGKTLRPSKLRTSPIKLVVHPVAKLALPAVAGAATYFLLDKPARRYNEKKNTVAKV